MSKKRLVVIGNGMAGIKVIEHLLDYAPDLYDITVFGAEPYGNYNRIMLSPVLAGQSTLDDIMLNTPAWYAKHGITLHAGETITSINRAQRSVTSDQQRTVAYDRLLIATGSRSFKIPLPGADLPGVIGFRDIDDVNMMTNIANQPNTTAVVIGGGLLGLEAAYGLKQHGMHVTVVHLTEYLMNQQLDPMASDLLKQNLEKLGINIELSANSQTILGNDNVTGLQLKSGKILPANMVVMAAGIRPNIELAQAANLPCERAILVDDTLQTYDPAIYAVGECAQHRGQCYGLVSPLWEQAPVCAAQLAEQGHRHYAGSITATTLKVSGVNLYSAGNFMPNENDENYQTLVYHDHAQACYKKLVIQDNKLVGTVLYGDAADGPWYFELIQSGQNISAAREKLIFGQHYAAPLLQADTNYPLAKAA